MAGGGKKKSRTKQETRRGLICAFFVYLYENVLQSRTVCEIIRCKYDVCTQYTDKLISYTDREAKRNERINEGDHEDKARQRPGAS